jgi:thioredoxin reductase
VIKKWIKYIAVYAAVTFAAKGLIGYVKHRIRYGRDIAFLNFALALEKQQTVYYKVQYDYLKNDEKTYHLAVGLDRASKVEKDHVDKINDAFYDIGLKPPKYTDVAYTTGIVTGELLGRMSPKKVLQALVWIEQKAIDHYHKAAKRGFDVELWEKNFELGGALIPASTPVFKESVARYLEYLKVQIYKSNVKVRLNKEATHEEILRMKPDAVIIAGGAHPIIPKIQGMEKNFVIDANQMLTEGDCPGDNVVVLGGGLVGCEAALHLDSFGKNVTIVEKLDELLLTVKHATNNDLSIKNMLSESDINIMTGAVLSSINEDSVTITKDGKDTTIPCDTVVLAVGYESDHRLEKALEGKIDKVFTIGDNVEPTKVIDAVHQGYHTARLLEVLN